MDSLDLLLDTVRQERSAQLSHFDSLDSKAGIVLGFAAALIALSSEVSNRSISAKRPEDYLPDVVASRGADTLTAQGIPLDPAMWKLENFREFLDYRRAELARMVNEFLDGITREGSRGVSDIASLVADGEGPTLEFKETARFNIRTGTTDKVLEGVVAKTVAGFLNTSGGTLVIGVDDAGLAKGLERDLATLSKTNLDGYQQFLRTLLNNAVGPELCARVGIEFPVVDGTEVCVLRIPASPRAVWITSGQDKAFYVRSGNTTQPLDPEQAHNYVAHHWRV